LFLPIFSRYFETTGETSSEAAGIVEKIAPRATYGQPLLMAMAG
jgi:hypothetical protein